MAFDNSSVYCHVFDDFEIPFDEKGSTYGSVRSVQWVKEGTEPDESKAKVEIRKIYTSGGDEKIGKGYTFSTPDGPSELAEGLIKIGYGNTKNILRILRERDDFMESAKTINEDNIDDGSGEMFDMRDLLLSKNDEEEEDEE